MSIRAKHFSFMIISLGSCYETRVFHQISLLDRVRGYIQYTPKHGYWFSKWFSSSIVVYCLNGLVFKINSSVVLGESSTKWGKIRN